MIALDVFSLSALLLFASVALITALSAPKRDRRDVAWRASISCVVVGTVVAYAASSPWLFLAGWTLTIAPMWFDDVYSLKVRLPHVVSTVALAAGFALSSRPSLSFFLLAIAALVRKGALPFHYWVADAFERGSLGYLNLFLNGHLGAYLVVRFALTSAPQSEGQVLSLFGIVAALTATATALVALVSSSPRRVLGLICVSQAAFIMTGLASRSEEGIAGALLHWWAVAFGTTGALLVYRALEARTSEAGDTRAMLGLGTHAPRLAVYFAASVFALVGLPGTLGFVAEDLLFHGALTSYPFVGLCLPVATALNAITVFRIFTRLFMGRRAIHATPVPDATPRERWAFTMPVLLLVVTGLAPGILIALHGPATQRLAELLGH